MQIPKEEVRQAILSAAEEEILQTGYRSCSIRSIAARAGISPGNIYAYFSGKEEILDCILRPALGGIHGVMESPFPEGSPGEMVRQVTGRLAEVFLRYKRPCLILAARVEGTPYEPVKEQLGREIAARAYKELLPPFPPGLPDPAAGRDDGGRLPLRDAAAPEAGAGGRGADAPGA